MKNSHEEFYPAALTIAGSDSGGGAGIQADLRTFNAAGVYGCSVITAVTAQNPRQVANFTAVSAELVSSQYRSVTGAIAIKAIKTGMLANGDVVEAVVRCLQKKSAPLVIDPVMISSSNTALLDPTGMEAVRNKLLPLADLITPNLPEAEWLLKRQLKNENDYIQAAIDLAKLTKGQRCLLKTGHADNAASRISDIAVLGNEVYLLSSPKVEDLSEFAAHGTGCTLSAAITAMLAAGNSWKDALRAAKAYVYGSLCETAHIGKDLDAMYPPLEDYSKAVTMRRWNGNAEKRIKNAR